MNLPSEDSPAVARASNDARLAAWRLLGEACRAAVRAPRDRSTTKSLLALVLEATGAERAYLLQRRRAGAPSVRELCCRRNDGRERPSRTAMLCSVAREQAFICADIDEHRQLAGGASIRSLRLRSIFSAPLPASMGGGSLLLDSRLDPALPPPQLQEILECFASLLALIGLDRRNANSGRSDDLPQNDGLVGKAPIFTEMLSWVRLIAASELPVLIQGETGSGKEGVARRLHLESGRAEGPFVPVNCTALTETLIDAELFGSLRGSYTGAERDRSGLFRQAGGGTLFLDEIGDTSPAMQAKLLRAIQEKRVRPVGGDKEMRVDTRIVAATNQELAAMVRQGRFRADLYHRIAVLEVNVPPLRERLDDLRLLVEKLAPRIELETRCGPLRLASAVWRRLRIHTWPGNVRELHAVLARAALRAEGSEISVEDLGILDPTPFDPAVLSERSMIEAALETSEGNIAAAARLIGWSRSKLYRRMEALSIHLRTTSSASSTFQ
jgi:two-component system response regulator PilR (NtrC family)